MDDEDADEERNDKKSEESFRTRNIPCNGLPLNPADIVLVGCVCRLWSGLYSLSFRLASITVAYVGSSSMNLTKTFFGRSCLSYSATVAGVAGVCELVASVWVGVSVQQVTISPLEGLLLL